MKKMMVYDVPAEKGGALTILKQYYDEAVNDVTNEYVFVLSTPEFKETANVKVLNYPWIKKSWFHRLYFDHMVAPKIAKKYQPDSVLSLQNVRVPRVKCHQTIYVHQCLPFIKEKFSLKKYPKYWIYQNVIGRTIKSSIKKVDEVIVQTQWMKQAVQEQTGQIEKVIVEAPKVDLSGITPFNQSRFNENHTFFYPASLDFYKNYAVIIEACIALKKEHVNDYTICLTVGESDFSAYYPELHTEIIKHQLPIEFLGKISLEEVYKRYSSSVLLFPSYIETFGLPLLEARESGAPVICADTLFSREILAEYDQVSYFDRTDFLKLSVLIKNLLKED